jgi:transposase
MQRYFRKLSRGERLDDKPRSGRPPLRTSTLRRQLGQLLSRDPEAGSSRLAAALTRLQGRNVSLSTTLRVLHDIGRKWHRPVRKRLNAQQRTARVAFARAHLDDSWDDDWAYDESYFNLYRTGNRYWLKSSSEELESYPKLTRAQEKISIGIGVAISRGRKSALIVLSKGWKASELVSKFDSTLYPGLRWSNRLGKQSRLIIDNDGRHTTTAWKDYMARKQLRPLDPWPSNSPDLSPVENVFSYMKCYVESRHPSNAQELEKAVRDAWQAYPVAFTENLFDSMPRRMQQVMDTNGARIRY